MQTHSFAYWTRHLFVLMLFTIIAAACSKSNPPDTTNNNNGNTGSSGNGGSGGNQGSLLINISWSKPSPTVACPTMAFVDVEIKGGNTNFSQTYSQSSVRIDKRLNIGSYSYTIKKRPNTSCSSFTAIVKSGTFTINACPSVCGNATVLNFTLD